MTQLREDHHRDVTNIFQDHIDELRELRRVNNDDLDRQQLELYECVN